MKKNKSKRELKQDQKKVVKWLKVIIVLCIAIIVIELGYIGLSYYNRSKSIIYTDTLNSFEKVNDGYLVAGNSDFKNSSFNSYQDKYNKAKFAKYNNDFEIEFESAYTKGYGSFFNDVVTYDDGYIAVGGAQYDEQQVEDNATDGLIVLYDKDGKQVDTKTVQIAGDTTFTKVLLVDDGFIVIGQSILQNMVIGNNPKGGALMIKYSFDLEEEWRTNYGGSKSGIFNDAIIDGDYIYLVGKDATRYGMIAKYTLSGERVYAKTYEYTDTVGFSSIVKVGDNFFVAGSKTINIDAKDEDKVTEALILKYDSDDQIFDIGKRPIDFVGFKFTYGKTTTRNSIFRNAINSEKALNNQKYGVHNLSSVISYNGWLNVTDCYTVKHENYKHSDKFYKMKLKVAQQDSSYKKKVDKIVKISNLRSSIYELGKNSLNNGFVTRYVTEKTLDGYVIREADKIKVSA